MISLLGEEWFLHKIYLRQVTNIEWCSKRALNRYFLLIAGMIVMYAVLVCASKHLN